MEHIRKWFYRPKRDDSSLLAQFFYADEALNVIANELDSFDGRKDPERCTALVNQLRQSQDKVLTITNAIMDALIGDERANRDFRAKFPEDVLQENLAGQLWFGAECLAAGSSIMNREFESAAMRPLAKAVTKSLENVRNLLRSTCLRNNTPNSPIKLDNNEIVTEMLLESLKIFDRLFAEFELAYVSAMVPVKSTQEYELQEMISVHFSETLQRALKMKLITQEMVDDCDPALMFTVPRLAIVSGLLSATSGPLCIDKPTGEMSEMFRPFRTLLLKIRELLWTLNRRELYMLEKLLCHNEEIDDVKSVSELNVQGDSEEFIEQFYNDYLLSRSDYISYVNGNVCDKKCKEEDQESQASASGSKEMVDKVVDFLNSQGLNLLLMSSSPSRYIVQPYTNSSEANAPSRNDDQGVDSSSHDCDCLTAISEATTTLSSLLSDKVEASKTQPTSPDKSTLSSPNDSGISENASLDRSPSVEMEKGCCCGELRDEAKGGNKKDKKPNRNITSPSSSSNKAVPKNVLPTRKKNKYTIVNENGIEEDVLSTSSSDTSSFHSNCADDLEIAMAVQAAEMASRNEVRAKYSSSEDLIHRLFVCVAGVADQLQTNFASDLRNILKSVFLMNASDSNETTEEKNEPSPSLENSIEYRPSENEVTENNEFTVDPNILAQEALFDSNIYFRIEEENNEEESNAEGRNQADDDVRSDPGLSPAVLEVTTNGYSSGPERQNEPETEQPPMWIPDIEAPKCMSCGCNFTVVKRRHHCRNCGKVFCSRCSSNSVPLPKFGIVKPVRVCNKCFMYNLNPFTVRPYM